MILLRLIEFNIASMLSYISVYSMLEYVISMYVYYIIVYYIMLYYIILYAGCSAPGPPRGDGRRLASARYNIYIYICIIRS